MRAHIEALGYHQVQFESQCVRNDLLFEYGWYIAGKSAIPVFVSKRDEYVFWDVTSPFVPEGDGESTLHGWAGLEIAMQRNVIRLGISTRTGEVRVLVPPTCPERFYYAEQGGQLLFTNDLRLLFRLLRPRLDEVGVYALLQYGTIPPPFTLAKGVRRLLSGHVSRFRYPEGLTSQEVCFVLPGPSAVQLEDDVATRVLDAIDGVLSGVPNGSVVYFSGGNDSGLLAARLAAQGRKDIRLVNYALSASDRQGHYARDMARELGLSLEQVMHNPTSGASIVERIPRDYSFPFGDFAVTTMSALIHASGTSAGSSVVQGDGADASFGSIEIPARILRRMRSLPEPMRACLRRAYEVGAVWNCRHRIERGLRVGAAHGPIEVASLASNALDGTAYVAPEWVQRELTASFLLEVDALGGGLGFEDRLGLSCMLRVGCERIVAKSLDPLHGRGVRVLEPFLHPRLLSVGFSLRRRDKARGWVQKALLKELLARQVSPRLVYRRKSGFLSPIGQILSQAGVREFIRDVTLSGQNPVLDFCDKRRVFELVEQTLKTGQAGASVYHFLWTFLFTSAWLRQPR
jgi:asparagine synthetase B (glutamine-hydrolysing)